MDESENSLTVKPGRWRFIGELAPPVLGRWIIPVLKGVLFCGCAAGSYRRGW